MAKESIGREKLMKKLKAEQKKNADARARKKTSSGSLTERARKAGKSAPEKRGLPAIRKENLPEPRKNNLPAIRKENLPVVYEERPSFKPSIGGLAARIGGRAAGRMLGPVGALIGMTEPAGGPEESASIKRDKSYGPLMKGKAPRYSYPYTESVNSTVRADREPAPKPKARPVGGMTETKRRAATEFRKKAQGQKKVEAPKFKAPKVERPKFRGNWTGAAPTQMQSLAAQKPKRKSFSDLFKSK